MRILILNGPNLNMLGVREPDIYGHATLADIHTLCTATAAELGQTIDFRQTNHEGVLVDWVQEVCGAWDALVINAAAYTHTSVALHDALKILKVPVVEVHLSDPETREPFRHISYVAPAAAHIIKGHGAAGYEMALRWLAAQNA